MRINPTACLIRVICDIAVMFSAIILLFGLFLNFIIEDKIQLGFIIAFAVVLFVRFLIQILLILLNKSETAIVFYKHYIIYRKQKIYKNELTLRYFKFQWTFLESVMVYPKLVISFYSSKQIICYITKRQLKKLKDCLDYDIKEI